MTAQLLTSELSTLLQESKRKNPDLRNAADKSLSDLKALPRTSEAQIAADLKSRPNFVRPFLLACTSRNPKFAGSAIICLQRLIVVQALPSGALAEVLEALKECSTLALDIQLKVLQAIPSLLQNYAAKLTGQLLTTAFQVCFLLYGSKTSVVSNTAAAALQQLVNSTFEKAGNEEGNDDDDATPFEAPMGDGHVTVVGSALDAYQLLDDLCLMTEGQKPRNLVGASLAQNFGLELLESILTNHAEVVVAHPEQIHILRLHLMPLIIKMLSEKTSFPLTVRAMRVLQLVLTRLLFALASECEIALSLLNHMLDPDAAVLGKRTLCLEIFKSLHAEPALVRNMYVHFDEQDENRNIIRDHLSSVVRLASEKPAVIGLGQQSSIPIAVSDESGEQAAFQAGGFIGTIGASVSSVDINTPGISNRWSIVRTPCIDMLDKNDAPQLPATYIYSLALNCVTLFSEGLARFLLPFTVPFEPKSRRRHTRTQDRERNSQSLDSERQNIEKANVGQQNQNRRIPTNPLSLTDHVLYSQIATSSHMVDQCWPALLAASSTFLNASMDAEHYHSLIRSFQKFTQIAGLLDLRTPRDAFLTTLGKHSVPLNASSKSLKTPTLRPISSEDSIDNSVSGKEPDAAVLKSPGKRKQSLDSALPLMNTRHLLCLRALLNLGIALGPFLQQSWSIILETLQQMDLVMNLNNSGQGRPSNLSRRKSDFMTGSDGMDNTADLALEITAAETAASRMFESTSELPSDAFFELLQCICVLLRPTEPEEVVSSSPGGLLSPTAGARKHQKLRSVSGTSLESSAADRESLFILEKLQQVVQNNVPRLVHVDAEESGWNMLTGQLTSLLSSQVAPVEVRSKAAATLHELAVLVATPDAVEDNALLSELRCRSFDALLKEIKCIQLPQVNATKTSQQCDLDIHSKALEAAQAILEQSGDTLMNGWVSVFDIVDSIFNIENVPMSNAAPAQSRSAKLVRSSFGSLQLICSDFLTSVPPSSLPRLLDTLTIFASQDQDLNISLTTATLFRNISDFILRITQTIDLNIGDITEDISLRMPRNEPGRSSDATSSRVWLFLLSKLVLLSVDGRLEARHSESTLYLQGIGTLVDFPMMKGMLRTLFGILDNCIERLTAAATQVCFQSVLLGSLKENEKAFAQFDEAQGSNSGQAAWNATAAVLVEGSSKLFSQWLESLADKHLLTDMFDKLLEHFERLLARKASELSRVVFTGLARMLSEIENSEMLGEESIRKCWLVWQNNHPARHSQESDRGDGNQDALLAHLESLGQLLRLTRTMSGLDHIKTTLNQLYRSVVESSTSAYSSDVDQMTAVQKTVLECLKRIPTKDTHAASELLDCIALLVTLSYDRHSHGSGGQTYLALSKAAMSLMESFVVRHIQGSGIFPSKLLSRSFQALGRPLNRKYHCHPEGKTPSPWRKATSVGIAILKASEDLLKGSLKDHQGSDLLWATVVDFNNGVIKADCDACSDSAVIEADEESDVTAYLQIKAAVIPVLGSHSISDKTRKAYAESIFQHSMIHEPHPDDLARPSQGLLEGLGNDHIGRVQDLPPSPRSKLGYILLDDLFDLVNIHRDSSDYGRLAQAVAPYLILRAGLTLKAYIYDQPLRGLMSQPWSQKEETLILLRKLIDLDSDPNAIPAMPAVASKKKKHLHRLYPLVLRALDAACRDAEMEDALKEVLEAIGTDFAF